MTAYLPVAGALTAEPPATLDFLEFGHRGVRIRAYGFLHGVTGGPNAAYRSLVRRSVAEAPGLVLGEMGLRRAGLGIRRELDDHLPVGFRDAFSLGLRMVCHPVAAPCIAAGAVMESVRRADPIGPGRMPGIVDLARSPRFHLVDPWERRALSGLPGPEPYLRLNLARRRRQAAMKAPRFPDPMWSWLTVLEPWANIPARSVHMLEFAAELALAEGHGTASLFVGETHNTDMHWLAHGGLGTLPEGDRGDAEAIAEAARRHARAVATGGGRAAKLPFSCGIALGASPALALAAAAALA